MTSEQVKKIRQQLFMTQNEFADFFNVSVIAVSCWERGKYSPSLKVQKQMYDFCKENNIKWEK